MTKNRIVIIALCVVVLVVLFFGYKFFFGGEPAAETTGLRRESYTPTTESDKLLKQLQGLQTITLDASILQSRAFQFLHDFTPIITPIPAGRRNPFAPVTAAEQPQQILLPPPEVGGGE